MNSSAASGVHAGAGSHVLLVDAPTGIAGDMFLAALAGLGFDLSELQNAFTRGGIELSVDTETVSSHGLAGRRLKLQLPEEKIHRHLGHCLAILDRLQLPSRARALAGRCFERLARVEGALHGVPPEQVHFHEVGAMDSLLDIAGAALGLTRLGVTQVHVRDLAVGHGAARMAHGELPLPAPATLALLEGVPLRESGIEAELVTPTGALILAETATPMPADLRWRVLRSGYGAGTREFEDRPNLLRLTLGELLPASDDRGVTHRELPVLRCTVDDMSAERCGYLMERLFETGALDVHFRPLQMKKNRPGVEIEVLSPGDRLEELQTLLFTETSTLGLRIAREERVELARSFDKVETPFGEVTIKVAQLPDGTRRAAPEYEDCARLARESKRPLAEVEEAARHAWRLRQRGR